MERKEYDHITPYNKDLRNGQFTRSADVQMFMGNVLPSSFHITTELYEKDLQEGAVIGYSDFGQILYWSNGQVIAKG